MDQQEASQPHSQRRLKRMRSDAHAPLRDSFNDPRKSIPNALDSDLQTSIRVQDAASKRARLSCSASFVNDSGSPIRRSRFVEGTMRDTASNPPPGDYLMSETRERDADESSAPSSGFSAAFRNALTPVWSGMSGIFGRRSTRDMSASAASVNLSIEASTAGRSSMASILNDHEPLRTHSSQSNVSSARDSGIYFFNGRPSLEQKPFASPEANPMNNLRGALNLSPTVPNGATFSPQTGDEVSPFKRLHRASVSSLRKVRSHFALSGLRRSAQSDEDSHEQSPAEQVPEVPAIPSQFIKANITKDDIKKRQKLEKKMSNLQSQLDQCKEEYAETFGRPGIGIDTRDIPTLEIERPKSKKSEQQSRRVSIEKKPEQQTRRVSGEKKSEAQSRRLSMDKQPDQQSAQPSTEPTRPLPSVPIYLQTRNDDKQVRASIEHAEPSSTTNGRLTALPQMPPSPPKQQPRIQASVSPALLSSPTSPALPVIEPGSVVENNNAAYREAAEGIMSWDFERSRRSLSTILSSRAASPEPLAELKPNEFQPASRNSMKPSSLTKKSAQQTIAEEDASKQENIPLPSSVTSAGTSTPTRSNGSKIPRNSPRKSRNDASDLPTINAVRSPARSAGRIGSPKKRSETDGVRKRRPKKKSLVGNELGQYNDAGEWVWGEETF